GVEDFGNREERSQKEQEHSQEINRPSFQKLPSRFLHSAILKVPPLKLWTRRAFNSQINFIPSGSATSDTQRLDK
ncbi:15668_t:CDS:2, partial [Funneliformis mosseae]